MLATDEADAPHLPVLVADLDNSLVATDLLYETFWSACARDWRTSLASFRALFSGRAELKALLAECAGLDVTTLPYNREVLGKLAEWRRQGGRTALVTASDRRLAEAVASHLGLFDEVHGSDGRKNLKGPEKALFLRERFAAEGFCYIGDSMADLPIWAHAHQAITVGAPHALRRLVEAGAVAGQTPLHIAPAGRTDLKPYVRALRPHQWLKNLLVFLPMILAQDFSWQTLLVSFTTFFAFCAVASSVYVLNDLLDIVPDRMHPRKRNRPFASGALRIQVGTWLAPLLLVIGITIALPLGRDFLAVLAGYYAVTLAYSLDLKRRTIVDICALALLYTFRIVAGGAATEIELSVWLLGFSSLFFFSLAAVKRQAELVDGLRSGKERAAGRGYMVDDLSVISMMATSSGFVSILVMALYITSDDVAVRYGTPTLLWGVCFILLYWISRIVMMTHRGLMDDDPVVFAVKDRNSRVCAVLILALVVGAAML